MSAKGDDATRAETGRAAAVGPGDGDGEFLAKGLLRELRAKGLPFGAGALMIECEVVVPAAGVCATCRRETHHRRNADPKHENCCKKNPQTKIMYNDAPLGVEVKVVVTMVLQRGGCMRERWVALC